MLWIYMPSSPAVALLQGLVFSFFCLYATTIATIIIKITANMFSSMLGFSLFYVYMCIYSYIYTYLCMKLSSFLVINYFKIL